MGLIKSIVNTIRVELNPLVLLLSASLITIILVPLGIVYNVGKAIYHAIKLKPLFALGFVGLYWVKIIYQFWNAIKYLLKKVAIALDLIWNATSGELIEDCVTAQENTLYGCGNVTVSASTGKLETEKALNKTGMWFTNLLSITLGPGHSVNAWNKESKFPINS